MSAIKRALEPTTKIVNVILVRVLSEENHTQNIRVTLCRTGRQTQMNASLYLWVNFEKFWWHNTYTSRYSSAFRGGREGFNR